MPETTQEIIERVGLIPVLRAKSVAQGRAVVDAMIAGGVTVVEVTMTVPGAIDLLKELLWKIDVDPLHLPAWPARVGPILVRAHVRARLVQCVELLSGREGVARMVSDPSTDRVLTAIVGSLVWAIVTSRDGQATAPTKIKSLRGLSTDGGRGTLSRLRPDA